MSEKIVFLKEEKVTVRRMNVEWCIEDRIELRGLRSSVASAGDYLRCLQSLLSIISFFRWSCHPRSSLSDEAISGARYVVLRLSDPLKRAAVQIDRVVSPVDVRHIIWPSLSCPIVLSIALAGTTVCETRH